MLCALFSFMLCICFAFFNIAAHTGFHSFRSSSHIRSFSWFFCLRISNFKCVCYLLCWNRIVFLLNWLEELYAIFSLMHRSIFSTGCPYDICTMAKLHVCGIFNMFFFLLFSLLVFFFILFSDLSLSFYAINTTEITKVFIKYGIG